MRVDLAYGLEHVELEVPDRALVRVHRQPTVPPIADVPAAVAAALETPLGYPALRRALTPDDHVAIVVDESLPHLASLLTPVLAHVASARVPPEAITLVCAPSSTGQPWVEDLPEAYEEVRLEVHDPHDRNRWSYLATTKRGRRIYINRTVVDADQIVVLSGRGYDPALGYAGAETALFPALSDEPTRREAAGHVSLKLPGAALGWRHEAAEVAWLLGAPFLVQVIEGANGEIAHVLGGPVQTSGEGQRLLDARWRVDVDAAADVVIAGIGGDPARQSIAAVARALACAARVVKPHGRIALLCAAAGPAGKVLDALRQAETPEAVLSYVKDHPSAEMHPAFQWASTAKQATIYLHSQFPPDTAEELFTVPMEHARQAQRLIQSAETCLIIPDAHKTMAVIKE